jgi:hypothetical protein
MPQYQGSKSYGAGILCVLPRHGGGISILIEFISPAKALGHLNVQQAVTAEKIDKF